MKVKITDVGGPFNYQGEIGFNVGIECGDIHTSAFVKPGDDLYLVLGSAVNKLMDDKEKKEAATRFSDRVKSLIGSEIDLDKL